MAALFRLSPETFNSVAAVEIDVGDVRHILSRVELVSLSEETFMPAKRSSETVISSNPTSTGLARSVCRAFLSVLSILLLWLLASTTIVSSAQAAKEDASLPEPQKAALNKAMRMYGWAIPVCVWPIRPDVKPYCYTVAQLIQRFPLHADYLSMYVFNVVESTMAARKLNTLVPEDIIQELNDLTYAGCVPKGPTRGAITFGEKSIRDTSGRLNQMKKGCESSQSGGPGADLAFGVLTGIAPHAPYEVGMNAEDQAAYKKYVEACESARANPQGKVAASAAQEKKEEEAKKAKEEAEKKAKDAADAEKKADADKKEADQKQKAADAVANDPNASQADKDAAQADADKAAGDSQISQDDADRAADDAAMAQGAADQAARDVDTQKANDASTRDFIYGISVILVGLSGYGITVIAGGEFALLSTRLYFDREKNKGQECMEENCGSCADEARTQVIKDNFQRDKSKPQCNLNVMPLPDDDTCYTRPGSFFGVSEIDVVTGLELACKEQEKIGMDCSAVSRKLHRMPDKSFVFDPCRGPLVMCAPEQSNPTGSDGRGGSDQSIKSVPVPARYRAQGPAVWTNPASNQ